MEGNESERSLDKKKRFKRVAEQRTNRILKTIQLLANCSNKSNYEYNDADIKKIFTAIEKELKTTRSKFDEISAREKEFKL